ncbi:3223_t:CDS:2 [Paraglomus occultum]|uniref:3223_t:CDS:1 n=1 Tax=Paraglomus occultum TaxID=144539 RepID=A0A9N9EVV5_9GLOM|nr:3223_t:CDS:2 [Paraglomus occultum]
MNAFGRAGLSTLKMLPNVEFFYDIQCPWSYIASKRIEQVVQRTNATIKWVPVSLNGIYEITNATKDKSGTKNVLSAPKLANYNRDLVRTLKRFDIPFNFHPKHPLETIDALRLLHATPESHRGQLTHALYRLYWVDNADIVDRSLLVSTAESLNIPYPEPLTESIFENAVYQDSLREATSLAAKREAPGVPSFWVDGFKNGYLYYGQDRLHFVEAALLSVSKGVPLEQVESIESVIPRRVNKPVNGKRTLRFWFDFASPYSYLAYIQLKRVVQEAGPGVEIEYRPIILGALLTHLKTDPPLVRSNETERRYFFKDILDWLELWNIVRKQSDPSSEQYTFQWAKQFPIRTITALRIFLLEPKTIDCIFKACWANNIPIGESQEILASVLNEAGFDGEALIQATQANVNNVKNKLQENYELAIESGVCGVPAFQVDQGELVWGNDRIDVVQDLLSGWNPDEGDITARL